MELFQAIRARRSIRHYLEKPVEPEKLQRILDAARLAPSANNRQEWRFVVVRDREKRQQMIAAAANQEFVGQAPVVIACCSVEDQTIMRCGHPAYAIDLAIAIDHMTLAAAALDLGTCWIGSFFEDSVRQLLKIPQSVRIVELLTLGYPAEHPDPRPRKALKDIMCDDVWAW